MLPARACITDVNSQLPIPMSTPKKKGLLSADSRRDLLDALATRFEKNPDRHPGIAWADVRATLEAAPGKLWSLHEMERTGGEPDVVAYERSAGAFVFVDCSPQSPVGRHSLCYDRAALESRKEHKPNHSAVELASEMGIELLTEQEYRELQRHGEFDTKTSSWVKTPPEIRNKGGALFCDRRYDHVFVYHNGAQSYYSGRGFRGALRV